MRNKKLQSDKIKIIKSILTGNRQKVLNEMNNLPKPKKYHCITLIRDDKGLYQVSGKGRAFTELEANELMQDYTHSFTII